jgi:uncharacterized metal-binding protein
VGTSAQEVSLGIEKNRRSEPTAAEIGVGNDIPIMERKKNRGKSVLLLDVD